MADKEHKEKIEKEGDCDAGGTRVKKGGCVMNERLKEIRIALTEIWREYNPDDHGGFKVKIILDGEELMNWSHGTSDMGSYEDKKITSEDHFRVGSATKAFIVKLLLIYVDKGLLRLDDRLSKWYPRMPNAVDITLEMLANMTSGIPDPTNTPELQETLFIPNPFRQWNPKEIIEMAEKQEPMFPPGTAYGYSNTNTMLIAQIIEKTTGKPLSQLIEDEIASKLDLQETVMTSVRTTNVVASPQVHSYVRTPLADISTVTEASNWNISQAYGAVGINSTMKDLIRWAATLSLGTLLRRSTFKKQMTPTTAHLQTPNNFTDEFYYGLGLNYNHGWVYHPGSYAGMSNIVSAWPEKRIVVAVATNYSVFERPVEAISDMWITIVNTLYPDNQVEYVV
jgi:D-alanyl-D-alanine carboxypeptidase